MLGDLRQRALGTRLAAGIERRLQCLPHQSERGRPQWLPGLHHETGDRHGLSTPAPQLAATHDGRYGVRQLLGQRASRLVLPAVLPRLH